MSLLGAILGIGYTPPTPPPTNTGSGNANGVANGDNTGNDTQTTGAGGTQSSGEGAGTQTVPSAGQTPTGETTASQGSTSPGPSGGGAPRPAGTPVDASPTRADFSLVTQAPDEDSARAYAIAAQSRERLQNLVDGLAEGPKATPTLTVVPAEKPEPANAGAGSLNSNLSTLRGEKAAGAVLDKVA